MATGMQELLDTLDIRLKRRRCFIEVTKLLGRVFARILRKQPRRCRTCSHRWEVFGQFTDDLVAGTELQ